MSREYSTRERLSEASVSLSVSVRFYEQACAAVVSGDKQDEESMLILMSKAEAAKADLIAAKAIVHELTAEVESDLAA